MKVTFGNLHNSTAQDMPAFAMLGATKLPVKASYRVGRVIASVEAEMKVFHKEHIELIKKHGGVEDEQGRMEVPKDNFAAFAVEFADLLSEECEIWGDPIHPDLLGDAQIEPSALARLSWLITDGTEVAEKPKAAAATTGD